MDYKQFNPPLDRDSHYRTCALSCAISRAGQDGGIQNDPIDVLALAELYYGWLTGEETAKPGVEKKFLK